MLAVLAPQLTRDRYIQLFQYVLESILILSDEQKQIEGLTTLAQQLAGEREIEQVLEVTSTLTEEKDRVQILIVLAPRLTKKQLEQVLEVVLTLSSREERTRALITFLPLVPDQNQMLQLIQKTMLDTLYTLRYWSRNDTLFYLLINGFF